MSQKLEILESAGYRDLFKRDIYYNRDTKKMFSLEAVEDHDEAWLHERMGEPNPNPNWRLYFNGTVSDELKDEILNELG